MLAEWLLALTRPFASRWTDARQQRLALGKKASALRRLCERRSEPSHAVDLVLAADWLAPQYTRNGLLTLAERVRDIGPHRLAVVGRANLGHVCLLCQAAPADAHLLILHTESAQADQSVYHSLSRLGQKVTCLAADPLRRDTMAAFRRWLQGEDLDLLLIDSEGGFAQALDVLGTYAAHVHPDGLVAFPEDGTLAVLPFAELSPRLHLCHEARLLRQKCDAFTDVAVAVDEVLFSSKWFPAKQKRGEILPLLRRLEEMQPRALCEIGTAEGGNLCLFAQSAAPDARILSIDVGYTPEQQAAYPWLARSGQKITCMKADSRSSEAQEFVRAWLGDSQLDFLFIDGDHSLAGVSSDFRNYTPLVRSGGLIALHDIVGDYLTRHGVDTGFRVGEVPVFWEQLRTSYAQAEELIEHHSQDGFGIGLVLWDGPTDCLPGPQSTLTNPGARQLAARPGLELSDQVGREVV